MRWSQVRRPEVFSTLGGRTAAVPPCRTPTPNCGPARALGCIDRPLLNHLANRLGAGWRSSLDAVAVGVSVAARAICVILMSRRALIRVRSTHVNPALMFAAAMTRAAAVWGSCAMVGARLVGVVVPPALFAGVDHADAWTPPPTRPLRLLHDRRTPGTKATIDHLAIKRWSLRTRRNDSVPFRRTLWEPRPGSTPWQGSWRVVPDRGLESCIPCTMGRGGMG
jgi:hypothetical protein